LIRSVPGLEGHIWVPLGGNGLKYSTDHGATYSTLGNVPYCTTVGIGKSIAGASYPTIFIWGTVSGVTGLFRSTDQGATWLRMNDDAHEFGGASMLIGDMNVNGRVYMGAGGGRGVIYWEDLDAVQDPDPVTGIYDEHLQAFQMYPNPTDASITISDTVNLRSVTIRDVRGRSLSSSHNQGVSAKVSLEGLPAGIYLIEVVDQQGTTTITRVVKK
jgi:hypothetical protein